MTIDELLVELKNARKNGDSWRAKCPAHDGKSSDSLSITQGDGGAILLTCHAGCSFESIAGALGVKPRDLMGGASQTRNGCHRPAPRKPARTYKTAREAVEALERQHGPRSHTYIYHDGEGEPVGLVLRWNTGDGKDIRPVSLHADGWRIAAIPEPKPLYRLPDLKDAGDSAVLVVEGEKCADALAGLGYVVTTSSGGSNAARKTDWAPLAGRDVLVLPDNDKPGERYLNDVADELSKLNPPTTVRVLRMPGVGNGGDVADWILQREGCK